MKTFFLPGLLLLCVLPLCAQGPAPIPAPSDVTLHLDAVGGRHDFHLGEKIEIELLYSATEPSKYLLVSLNQKLTGGHGIKISCSPSAEAVGHEAPIPGASTFSQMLMATCGVGIGGGVGGGCGDCDTEYPLRPAPIRFALDLNQFVRFNQPGRYVCRASSADITMQPRGEAVRSALLVESNPLELTLRGDPAWSHAAAAEYAEVYQELCRDDTAAKKHPLQCFDVSNRLMYLRSPEALAAEVRLYDGKYHGWENGFWDAITQSPYAEDAVRLMTRRVQESDFQPSDAVIYWLAATRLKLDDPDSFAGAPAANYHAAAIESLRKYVRLLGESLHAKRPDVLQQTAQVYRGLASKDTCDGDSLIPQSERQQVLGAIGGNLQR